MDGIFFQIGEYIASNGGVVTAEELAPYLDVETTEKMVFSLLGMAYRVLDLVPCSKLHSDAYCISWTFCVVYLAGYDK